MDDSLIQAPDLPFDLQWIHTSQPLSLFDSLHGYVVLVHFFTASSVHCHHVFPSLSYLEQRFANRAFQVVSVHTGKFHGERPAAEVRRAARRHGLRHPIVVDARGELWKEYECRAWPAFCLIDSGGHIRFQGSGEPDRERMAEGIEMLLEEAAAEGIEPYTHIDLDEGDERSSLDTLAAPTALAVDAARGWLWIADSGRHRVVAVELDSGQVAKIVGSGMPGTADGSLEAACFVEPMGMELVDGVLFVADRGNHLIRRVDLEAQTVESVLGTGRPVFDQEAGAVGTSQPINSPSSLLHVAGGLFVAMTGNHQIWRFDIESKIAAPYVGSGEKGCFDGPALEASLGQPAALTVSGDRLAFVDSDTSSLRIVDLQTHEVKTLVKGGIYEWGDADGADEASAVGTADTKAALQSPRGIAWHGEDLIVADTLNDKIRRWSNGRVSTLPVRVCRPEGITVVGDTLFVADTGSDSIVKIDLRASSQTEFPIQGLPQGTTSFGSEYLLCEAVEIKATSEAMLRVAMGLPAGSILQPGTRPLVDAENHEGNPLLVDVAVDADVEDGHFMIRGLATGEVGTGVIHVKMVFATCQEEGALCFVHERRLAVPVSLVDDAAQRVDVCPAEPQ